MASGPKCVQFCYFWTFFKTRIYLVQSLNWITYLQQVGAWGCFDEFNRLEERMLSAVSQQVQTIQETLKTQMDANKENSKFVFGTLKVMMNGWYLVILICYLFKSTLLLTECCFEEFRFLEARSDGFPMVDGCLTISQICCIVRIGSALVEDWSSLMSGGLTSNLACCLNPPLYEKFSPQKYLFSVDIVRFFLFCKQIFFPLICVSFFSICLPMKWLFVWDFLYFQLLLSWLENKFEFHQTWLYSLLWTLAMRDDPIFQITSRSCSVLLQWRNLIDNWLRK